MKIRSMIRNEVALLTICALCILYANTSYARTTNTTVLPTEVTSAADGNVLMGVEGSFADDVKAAVSRVNTIRKEACKNGYPDPRNPSRKLTMADYIPIKWSSELEFIARIRAAEADIYAAHTRPTGKSCFDITGPNGITSYAEVLAWGGNTITSSVNLWYSEKNTWIKQKNGVTGHYTSMINPDTTYMGMANFNGTGAGEFTNEEWVLFDLEDGAAIKINETPLSSAKNVIQTVEVPSSSLSKAKIITASSHTAKKTLNKGASVQYNLVRTYDGGQNLHVLGNISWNSSKPGVATVSQGGKVKAIAYGKSKITAASTTGDSASVTVNIPVKVTASSITKITPGRKKLTITCKKCSVDGYEIQYCTKKNFKSGVKKKLVSGSKKNKLTIKKLKSRKKYYVRVRTYKIIGKQKYYSSWSKIKSAKTK